MSTVVPLRRETPADKRFRARLAAAAAPIKAANARFVATKARDELQALCGRKEGER